MVGVAELVAHAGTDVDHDGESVRSPPVGDAAAVDWSVPSICRPGGDDGDEVPVQDRGSWHLDGLLVGQQRSIHW